MSISTLIVKFSVRDLAKIIGRLSLYGNDSSSRTYRTKEASATTNYRSLREGIYKDTIVLHKVAKMDLDW